jgi:hypothetical protein
MASKAYFIDLTVEPSGILKSPKRAIGWYTEVQAFWSVSMVSCVCLDSRSLQIRNYERLAPSDRAEHRDVPGGGHRPSPPSGIDALPEPEICSSRSSDQMVDFESCPALRARRPISRDRTPPRIAGSNRRDRRRDPATGSESPWAFSATF